MKNNKASKKNNNVILGVVSAIVISIAIFTFLNSVNDDVTETAKFYGYDELDTYMEVLAVKASDGTIRILYPTYSTNKLSRAKRFC